MEKLKVLIVEDDRVTQAAYKHGLEDETFEKHFAGTGDAALATYPGLKPDIILLDIGLPDIDGITVLGKIRKEFHDTSTVVIIASYLLDRQNVIECKKLGIDGVIVKPINTQEISKKVLQYYYESKKMKSDSDVDIVSRIISHNWSNLKNIEPEAVKVKIELGMEVMLRISGYELELNSFITGVDHGKYLIVRCPKISAIETKLFAGNIIKVTYLYSGTIFIFESKILNYIKNPFKIILLSYPESVETQPLRRHNRIDCFIKASLSSASQGAEYNGVVLDISPGGCAFVAPRPERIFQPPSLKEKIELALEVPGRIKPLALSGELRKIAPDKEKIFFGIEFAESHIGAAKTVHDAIKTMMDLL